MLVVMLRRPPWTSGFRPLQGAPPGQGLHHLEEEPVLTPRAKRGHEGRKGVALLLQLCDQEVRQGGVSGSVTRRLSFKEGAGWFRDGRSLCCNVAVSEQCPPGSESTCFSGKHFQECGWASAMAARAGPCPCSGEHAASRLSGTTFLLRRERARDAVPRPPSAGSACYCTFLIVTGRHLCPVRRRYKLTRGPTSWHW